MNKKILGTLALALCTAIISAQNLLSPNGQLEMQFSIDKGKPTYTLSYKGKTVIAPSHLGIELKGEAQRRDFNDFDAKNEGSSYSLLNGFSVKSTETSTCNRPYYGYPFPFVR